MNVYLFRRYYETATLGWLVIGDQVLRTLELPWKDNQSNISCIPPGEYQTVYLPRSASGKYRKVWHVQETGHRIGILIHNGNLTDHTQGCILVGTKHGTLGGKPAVLASRTGMRNMLNLIGEQGFTLKIRGETP